MAKKDHQVKKDTTLKEHVIKCTHNPPSPSILFGRLSLMYITIVVTAMSIYIYSWILIPPEVPQPNLDIYWGPDPMNPELDVSVRPYRIEFSNVVINDLKERLVHRRPFKSPLDRSGFTYGFNTGFLTQVLDYWQNEYNFLQREDFLNKYNHFITKIQGLDIHFMHVKPKDTSDLEVLPLLLLHGWPGSVREFYEIIPKLTTPRPGYKFVFEIIAPSLPGYGFSQGTSQQGLGAVEIAVVMRNLMKRLGFERYYIQGGDWGHHIGSNMATLFPHHVLGFHTNMPMAAESHPLAIIYTFIGSLWPSLILEPELQDRMYPLKEHFINLLEETGYMHIQATKPDTIGIALSDSPAGLAAYILEKFSSWTNPNNKLAYDGNLIDKFSLTALLDNVMIYWVTNSITTSMRLYAETMSSTQRDLHMDSIPTNVPTWGIKFKHDMAFQPDCIIKLKFKNYLQSTIVEEGGHFPALEMPNVLADDIFKAVESFLDFYKRDKDASPKSIHEFTVRDINGQEVKLSKYKGHVVIIVNVASQCGYTDNHYKQLNELYDKYSQTKGLRILAFPCNQFAGQEPGTAKEIFTFAKDKGVKFDLFEKVDVNGEDVHPLWKILKEKQPGTLSSFIKWNFYKFIIDKNGIPVERFGPQTKPMELEPYLAKYW